MGLRASNLALYLAKIHPPQCEAWIDVSDLLPSLLLENITATASREGQRGLPPDLIPCAADRAGARSGLARCTGTRPSTNPG